jgi:hypothetical protein
MSKNLVIPSVIHHRQNALESTSIIFSWIVGKLLPDNTASYPRRQNSSRCTHFSRVCHACCMFHPYLPPWFDPPNDMWWRTCLPPKDVPPFIIPASLLLHLPVQHNYSNQYNILTHPVCGATCFHVDFLLGLFFDPEDGDDMFLRNVCYYRFNGLHCVISKNHRCENPKSYIFAICLKIQYK